MLPERERRLHSALRLPLPPEGAATGSCRGVLQILRSGLLLFGLGQRQQRMQRRQAQAAQAAWWPWQDAMGGPCTARRWQAEGLMAPDGVHFTPAGYARAARQLADSLARLAG
mgnify:CR=1 FL=1